MGQITLLLWGQNANRRALHNLNAICWGNKWREIATRGFEWNCCERRADEVVWNLSSILCTACTANWRIRKEQSQVFREEILIQRAFKSLSVLEQFTPLLVNELILFYTHFIAKGPHYFKWNNLQNDYLNEKSIFLLFSLFPVWKWGYFEIFSKKNHENEITFELLSVYLPTKRCLLWEQFRRTLSPTASW